MDNTDIESVPELGTVPVITELDTTDLQQSIDDLKEVIINDMEQQQQEKEQEKEEQKQIEIQQKKEDELNAKKTLEESTQDKENALSYQENTLSLQEGQADSLQELVLEMKSTNEHLQKQNDFITESSILLMLTIMITMSVKIFIDQISRW